MLRIGSRFQFDNRIWMLTGFHTKKSAIVAQDNRGHLRLIPFEVIDAAIKTKQVKILA